MRWATLLLVVLLAPAVAATELDTLLAEDRLRVRSWLEPAENIVRGQEVRLIMEVCTPRWFAGGTGIRAPEVPGLLILRRNEFAVNLSRREAGATWVVQRWQLELYPQREGSYRLPPVSLSLAVNDATLGIVRGEVQTDALAFNASLPAAVARLERWLATPSLAIRQRFDRSLEGLAPGDAFTRTIEVEATRLTALMLPEPALEEAPGLAVYPDLPEMEDRSNRGEATALRRQSATYVVEQPGQYRLPAQTIYWWNTDTGSLESAVLDAVEIDAGAAPATAAPASPPLAWLKWLPVLLGAAALALLVKRFRARAASPLRRARQALRRGDARGAARALYGWLNTRAGTDDWLSLRASAAGVDASAAADQLLTAAYSSQAGPLPDASQLSGLNTSPARPRAASSGRLNPTQPRK